MTSLPLALVACAADQGSRADLTPSDFVVTGEPADAEVHDDVSESLQAAEAAEAEAAEEGESGTSQPPPVSGPSDPADAPSPHDDGAPASQPQGTAPDRPSSAADERFVMDAMVGQVNGRAIYAATVLEPIHEQLGALGRSLPPSQFTDRARQIISATLDQLVTDALILGEAERELTEQQRMGLTMMVDRHREELLRRHGKGSPSLAEHQLLQETGRTLDQTLRDFRNQRVVQHYLQQRLLPRINVTRRDIERYYRDHHDEFNPQTQRVLRLIRVESEVEASQITRQLEAGTPFAEVAAGKLNLYRPQEGGLMDQVVGDEPFSQPALNEALVSLKPGDYAGPFEMNGGQAFAYLESVHQPDTKTLQEAQLEIDRLLREQQFQRLSAQYRQRLFEEGSYNPIPQMTDDLLQIAVARYASQ